MAADLRYRGVSLTCRFGTRQLRRYLDEDAFSLGLVPGSWFFHDVLIELELAELLVQWEAQKKKQRSQSSDASAVRPEDATLQQHLERLLLRIPGRRGARRRTVIIILYHWTLSPAEEAVARSIMDPTLAKMDRREGTKDDGGESGIYRDAVHVWWYVRKARYRGHGPRCVW